MGPVELHSIPAPLVSLSLCSTVMNKYTKESYIFLAVSNMTDNMSTATPREAQTIASLQSHPSMLALGTQSPAAAVCGVLKLSYAASVHNTYRTRHRMDIFCRAIENKSCGKKNTLL